MIRRLLADAPVAHFDETGARVLGRLRWVHTACTAMLSYFTVHAKRGKEAMDAAGVLPGFAGVAVHDGWRPYRGYDVEHGLCNAHHIRELTAIAEQGDHQDWATHLIAILLEANEAVLRAKAQGAKRLAPEMLAALRSRYQGHVAQGQQANPRDPGSRARSDAFNLLARLGGYIDDVLRFTTDFAVAFSNNQAERDIRMVKLQQKISGGWRTQEGAQAFMTVRSYLATARKHGINLLDALRQAFEGNPWTPHRHRPTHRPGRRSLTLHPTPKPRQRQPALNRPDLNSYLICP